MRSSEYLSVVDPPNGLRDGPSAAGDLEEAERLIADLAALVDAGLVVVRKQLGGPARYAVDSDLRDVA